MTDQNKKNTADDDVPSKTARKREADRLQNVGRRLGALNTDQLDGLSLPTELLTAIKDYQRFTSNGARRRQLQFIGKLMRNIDTQAIEDHLADMDGESAQARYLLHQVEQWREALIHDPDALTRFISEYPDVDRQQLRQILKKIHASKDATQQKSHTRSLFRIIREIMEPQED